MSYHNQANQVIVDYSNIASHTIAPTNVEGISDMKETFYINPRAAQDWAYFKRIPKLKSAILMKAIWTVGKGYTTDAETQIILDHIQGNGKQTFKDILFDMVVSKQIFRDSYAEIIRDKDTGVIINLRVLNPQTIRIVYDDFGMIARYEQMRPNPQSKEGSKVYSDGVVFATWEPKDILHLSHNRVAGEIHGISVPESVEDKILADDENFTILKKVTRFQAVPFIIYKVKSDNQATIDKFKQNIKDARETGDDLIIPDDENILTVQVVEVAPSSLLMEWRNSLNQEFYQAVGLPLILFGSAGTTESGGKIEYLAHETVFEHDQKEIEEQLYAQMNIKINLYPPTSLLESLQQDENKDAQNGVNFSPGDVRIGG